MAEEHTGSKNFVSFVINSQWYCVEVSRIKEIILPLPLARIFHAQEYFAGMINLRGTIYTIIDLKNFVSGFKSAINYSNFIIFKESSGNHFGIAVEEMGDYFTIALQKIENVTTNDLSNTDAVNDYITGICKLESQIITILDVSKIYTIALNAE